MRDKPWIGHPAKPHNAAANADREDDHAPGNGISKTLAPNAIRRRMSEVGKSGSREGTGSGGFWVDSATLSEQCVRPQLPAEKRFTP